MNRIFLAAVLMLAAGAWAGESGRAYNLNTFEWSAKSVDGTAVSGVGDATLSRKAKQQIQRFLDSMAKDGRTSDGEAFDVEMEWKGAKLKFRLIAHAAYPVELPSASRPLGL